MAPSANGTDKPGRVRRAASSHKGMKWSAPLKSEPWHCEALNWNQIKHMFPQTYGPCEAIIHTARKMKQMGLIKTAPHHDFTKFELAKIRNAAAKESKEMVCQ